MGDKVLNRSLDESKRERERERERDSQTLYSFIALLWKAAKFCVCVCGCGSKSIFFGGGVWIIAREKERRQDRNPIEPSLTKKASYRNRSKRYNQKKTRNNLSFPPPKQVNKSIFLSCALLHNKKKKRRTDASSLQMQFERQRENKSKVK